MPDVDKKLSPEESAFVKRLATAINDAGGPKAVSDRVQIPLKTVYNFRNGTNASVAVTLAKLAQACGLSLDRLVSGAGAAISGTQMPDQAAVVQIPILNVVASAGGGSNNDGPEIVDHLPFSTAVLRKLGINPLAVRALRSRGDSMWPTIPDGVLILMNTAATDLVSGEIYVLHAPDGLVVKRVQRQMDGALLLISDNKDLYDVERVPPHEVERLTVVGHAFWSEKFL